MKRSMALLGLLLLAGAASAQDVPFETLARGAHGAFGPAAEHVIRSEQELRSKGVDRLLPPGTRVDWTREMVLAVFMGQQSSGGYSIEVKAIERKQMMTILPVPAPPPTYYLEVQVERRTPPPGSIVTMALTSPYHVVKLARARERVDFVAAAPAAAFDAVERNVSSIPRGERVRIARDGSVLIQRTQINALIAPIHGAATRQELDDLERVLRAADVTSLPAQLPPPSPAPAGASQYRLLVEGGALAHETRALSGFYGQYGDRIGRINAVIDRIVQRVEQPARAFTALTFDLTKQPGSRGVSLRLAADGQATVQRTLPDALIAPVSGQATQQELDAVDQAVRGARLATIPVHLPTPVHIMAADTFTVEVASDDPALAGRTRGEPGYLEGHEARLRPLLDALQAIVDRIAPEAPQPTNEEARGVVRLEGGDVLLVESPGRRYKVSNPEYAAIIRNFVGRTVVVKGVIQPVMIMIYPATIPVEVVDILSPERRAGEVVQVQPAGASVRVHVQGARVRTSGPAASVLRRAGGRSVTLDGWLFSDPQGRPSELFVESVEAEARVFSILTRGGQWAGYLRRGQTADILRVNGAYSLVRAGNRVGYVRSDRLEVGEAPVPLHTPGLSSSVPGQ